MKRILLATLLISLIGQFQNCSSPKGSGSNSSIVGKIGDESGSGESGLVIPPIGEAPLLPPELELPPNTYLPPEIPPDLISNNFNLTLIFNIDAPGFSGAEVKSLRIEITGSGMEPVGYLWEVPVEGASAPSSHTFSISAGSREIHARLVGELDGEEIVLEGNKLIDVSSHLAVTIQLQQFD